MNVDLLRPSPFVHCPEERLDGGIPEPLCSKLEVMPEAVRYPFLTSIVPLKWNQLEHAIVSDRAQLQLYFRVLPPIPQVEDLVELQLAQMRQVARETEWSLRPCRRHVAILCSTAIHGVGVTRLCSTPTA